MSDETPVSGNLHLTVVRARDIAQADEGGKNDLFVKIEWPEHDTRKTSTKHNTGKNAEWGESFDYQTNGVDTVFIISIQDKDTIGSDNIGSARVKIADLIEEGDGEHWVDLFDGVNKVGEISLSCSFYEHEAGQLKIIIKEGRELADKDTFGKQDPFVKIYMTGDITEKTAVAEDGGKNPKWGEEFVFLLKGHETDLELVVFDHDATKDDKIGGVHLSLIDVKRGNVPDWLTLKTAQGDGWVDPTTGELDVDFIWTPHEENL